MAATLLSTVIAAARVELKETVASYWTDAELLTHLQMGINDLWGALVDLHQWHYATVDETNVSLAASSTSLTGVPADVFRILLIEPRDTTSAGGNSRNIVFVPRPYNSAEFNAARSMDAQDTLSALVIYYTMMGAGAPVGAPTVEIAPQLTGAINLRFVYIPTPGSAALTTASNNPIPGESDNALKAWVIAYAHAKDREDKSPDPNWLAIYATEKQNLLTRMTPRQEQEPEIVGALFEEEW